MSGEGARDHEARVAGAKALDDRTLLLAVECPAIADSAVPGQFVMVRAGSCADPFLGRPLAVAGASDGVFKLAFRVVGRGTELLAAKRKGDLLVVRGPLGRGFFDRSGGSSIRVFLAGGGVGSVPLVFAAKRLGMGRIAGATMGVSGAGWEGFADWLKTAMPGADLHSDDGGIGSRGTALDGLPADLPEGAEIWACGPAGMLRALAARFPNDGGRIMVSLESRMACGVGGCLGCVIPTVNGNRRVCSDGPVFTVGEVLWDELED
ncbi:MAG: dihydroorotate dehydrogenase [Synergistaceae bacterium]|nr:dihydroorotate dehydrogenase [Synergistota bacterium]NLM71736.1 dihydroorotate dehydrogenase [Synergistaceae bacterium]